MKEALGMEKESAEMPEMWEMRAKNESETQPRRKGGKKPYEEINRWTSKELTEPEERPPPQEQKKKGNQQLGPEDNEQRRAMNGPD